MTGNQAPRSHARSTPGLLACLLALAATVAACSPGDEQLEQLDRLALERPPRFETLEPAVREQFDARRDRLKRMLRDSTVTADSALGIAWGELGQWFHVYRYPDSAMHCYRQAVRLDPDEPRWPYYLGMLEREAGELEAAESAFVSAVERAPTTTAALLRLAELKRQLQKDTPAESLIRQALSQSPDHFGANIAMAQLHLQNQEPRRAIERLQPLEADAGLAQGHVQFLLSQAYRMLGDSERARQHLHRVPAGGSEPPPLAGDDPWLDALMAGNISSNRLTRLGMRAYRRGDFRSATLHTGRAAELNPDNAELRANYAAALLGAGRMDLALGQAQTALRLDPRLARAHLVEAGSLLGIGKRTQARNALLRALELDPDLREARQRLGQLYQQSGETALAIEQYAVLRTNNDGGEQVRFWHAALMASLDRYAQALATVEEDLRMLPRSRLLELLRVRLLAAADDEAVRNPEAAAELLLQLDTGDLDVYHAETAAMVAAAQGDQQLAIAWQSRALDALGRRPQGRASHTVRRRLALYREGLICLDPWEPNEALNTTPIAAINKANIQE